VTWKLTKWVKWMKKLCLNHMMIFAEIANKILLLHHPLLNTILNYQQQKYGKLLKQLISGDMVSRAKERLFIEYDNVVEDNGSSKMWWYGACADDRNRHIHLFVKSKSSCSN
jgi:hypothetical protein